DAEDIISKAQNMMPEVKDTTQSGLETIDETMSFLKEAEDRLNEMAPEIEEDLKTAQSIADDVNSFIDDIKNVDIRSEEHTSELQSRFDLVCRLLLEKKKI